MVPLCWGSDAQRNNMLSCHLNKRQFSLVHGIRPFNQRNYATYVKRNFPPEDNHLKTDGCRVGLDPFIQQAHTLMF
jgi:hypothetical protein